MKCRKIFNVSRNFLHEMSLQKQAENWILVINIFDALMKFSRIVSSYTWYEDRNFKSFHLTLYFNIPEMHSFVWSWHMAGMKLLTLQRLCTNFTQITQKGHFKGVELINWHLIFFNQFCSLRTLFWLNTGLEISKLVDSYWFDSSVKFVPC